MAFPISSVTDLVVTTLARRSKVIADNVLNNNMALAKIKKVGGAKNIDGGRTIYEPFSFAANGNVGWYSGYDTLTTSASDVIGGAEFSWKQAACPVVISGLEMLKNAGESQVFDLLEARMKVAESSMDNLITVGLFSAGTGSGGKQLDGVLATAPVDPTTGVYGGINRGTAGNEFWRSYAADTNGAPSSSTIQAFFNTAVASLTYGKDRPDLIIVDNDVWGAYLASLQTLQRFTEPGTADLGFTTQKHMGADVVYDGSCTNVTAYFLNTKYLHFRSHKDRNMVPLGKNRTSINQDAEVAILAWAGNLTCSGARYQGQIVFS